MNIENNQINFANFTKEKNNTENFIQSLIKEIKFMNEIIVVDRIEGDIAVCEIRSTGKMIELNKSTLPDDIKDGTVLRYKDGEYVIDLEEQKKIENQIQELMKQVWNN